MSPSKPDKLMTPPEVAEYLDIKLGTLYKKIQAETIPFIRVAHNCVRFDRKALDKWLAQKTFVPVPKPLSLMRHRRKRDVA